MKEIYLKKIQKLFAFLLIYFLRKAPAILDMIEV